MGFDEKGMRRFDYKLLLKWMIVIAIFAFLGRMVWGNWASVKGTPFALRPLPFILSTLIFACSYFIQVWAWFLITFKLGIAISPSETVERWFYSQMGKYLPGKVWLLLGRLYFYESKGKSRKTITLALYLETATSVMAAGLLFLVALILLDEGVPFYSGEQIFYLIPFFLLAFLSLHPRLLQKIFNWILLQFKREPISLSLSYRDILWILCVSILAWLVGGIGFYLFIHSVFPVSIHQILFLIGALALSSILGLVALFAPSGLGVREGALVYLLSFVMPGAVAVILSVLTRIWMTLIEIGLIGVIYLHSKFKKGFGKRD
jgi:uncharacterized membrane protein YbhN (UPF0104 family)